MFNYEVAANVRQVLDNQNCQQIFILVKHLHLCLCLDHQRVDRPCDLLIHLRAVSNDRVGALPDSYTSLWQCSGWLIEGVSKIMYFPAPGILQPLQMHTRQFLTSKQVIRRILFSVEQSHWTRSSRTSYCPRYSVMLRAKTIEKRNVFWPFPWQSRRRKLTQFWILISSLFTET